MPQLYNPEKTTHPTGRFRRVLSCVIGQKRQTQICPETPRLDGKLALVTGGTSGIGAEIAKGLGRRGANVIVAARGGKTTERDLAAWHKETGANFSFLKMDLASLDSVSAAVESFHSKWHGQQLDVVCANAGMSPHKHDVSDDGYERAFAVNCLGHHLLLRGLQEKALIARGARIVGTTGDIYRLADECTTNYSYSGRGMQAYCRSKLGNLWQYQQLAERSPEAQIVIVHPGVVASGLEGPTSGFMGWVKQKILLSTAQGAQASLIAATQNELNSGDYFHNKFGRVVLHESDPANNSVKASAFWNKMEDICAPYLKCSTYKPLPTEQSDFQTQEMSA